jgi:hypothetical protein
MGGPPPRDGGGPPPRPPAGADIPPPPGGGPPGPPGGAAPPPIAGGPPLGGGVGASASFMLFISMYSLKLFMILFSVFYRFISNCYFASINIVERKVKRCERRDGFSKEKNNFLMLRKILNQSQNW